jgi:RNA polymerase sigma-70 factor (ECF subfamily)
VAEDELVQRSREGDIASFNQLVEIYQRSVFNLALRMLRDAQAAEDATQEAFLSAWRHIRSFRGGYFKAWLLSIVANYCRDELRRQKRRPAIPLAALEADPNGFSASTCSAEDNLLNLELREEIYRGLASLLPEQRLVIILSDIQGLSYEEIAKVTGCSLGTVKSRLSRGRTHLRDYLKLEEHL